MTSGSSEFTEFRRLCRLALQHSLGDRGRLSLGHHCRIWDWARANLKPEDILHAEWRNFKAGQPKLWGPPDFFSETTFADCLEHEYDLSGNRVVILLWDGDNFEGRRSELRCEFQFLVADQHEFVWKHAQRVLLSQMKSHAEQMYEAEQERQRALAINQIYESLIAP